MKYVVVSNGQTVCELPAQHDVVAFQAQGLIPQGATVHPRPDAGDVRAEAQRRIIALMGASDLTSCILKQCNANMRAVELTNKKATGVALSASETAEAEALEAVATRIKQIRAASNVLEADPPVDFAADTHWAA